MIMAPSKDMVLFVPAKEEEKLERMVEFGKEAYDRSDDKVKAETLIESLNKRREGITGI